MQHLDLSPLPCSAPPESPRPPVSARLGFVDDAVVLALLTGTAGIRSPQNTETIVLTVNEMDYAGWPPSVMPGARFLRRA